MQSLLNEKIKLRESFRPFAPSILVEKTQQYFQLPAGGESPYMLLTAQVAEGQRVPLAPDSARLVGLEQLSIPRSTIPAVTHVDHSARIQTVDADRNPRFHRLLSRWHERSGCPVLINTSFNVRGEPLVCSPSDAWRCFMSTDMDALVIGNFLLCKSDQPTSAKISSPRAFELD